ncbi:YaaR family protein [Calorimonas adulescens]|jgi:Protein of unknown function (DUF327).|uniref:DUF327 family protein n=1 Tax=Calorimonas adulescens TaxID=2606906 RepID=A0A5D8QC73_9THEO|nr:YaaR family protein [Calorimonas adulescens]TZE82141.1 DUF327 family protein [Calorimonas adulescens]
MKVENVKLNRVSTTMTVRNKNSGNSFKDSLLDAEGEFDRERFKRIMEDIDKKSQELKKTLDIKNLMEYKELVRNFLKEALSAFATSKKDYLDYRGRHKIYVIIEEVNEKLNKLTEDFMEKERDTIETLRKIDEIRGLLVDIYD